MRSSAFPALLAAAAIVFGNPAALPQQPPSAPNVGLSDDALSRLVEQSIWDDLYQALFATTFDVDSFWAYPLDRELEMDPADYWGQNQHGHFYGLHVLEVLDLGRAGRFSDVMDDHLGRPRTGAVRMWGVTVAMETPLAILTTQGIVAAFRDAATGLVDTRYIPARYYVPTADAEADHDCTPPEIPRGLCDPIASCEDGALRYLDTVCGKKLQRRFSKACERAWRDFGREIAAAETKHATDIDNCFETGAAGYVGSGLLGFVTLGVGALIGIVVTTVAIDTCCASADTTLELAKSNATQKRDNAISDAGEDFHDDLDSCCKDCPPGSGKPPPFKKDHGPERKP